LFYGNAPLDPKPDWVDLNNFGIPQADEQQRFLGNLILLMNMNNKPLPRFWYFPNGKKAVVVMTSDGHAGSLPAQQMDLFKARSPQGCSVINWECIRSTVYLFSSSTLTNAQAVAYNADGFEIAMHLNTGCNDWLLETTLRFLYLNNLADWQAKYSSVPPPTTHRGHCLIWDDYDTTGRVESEVGIRLNTNYYTYPNSWIGDRPGLMTGSGMPMRYAKKDGTMIDSFQANTNLHDDTPQTYPLWVDSLLDRAIGPLGYYGAFTTNFHVDPNYLPHPKADATITSALARKVPVVSAKQMLTWLDGRNNSSFDNIDYDHNFLIFTISQGAGTNGIQAMLPTTSADGPLVSVWRNGTRITFTKETIKGIEYAFFPADAGVYWANYADDSARPDATITDQPAEVTDSRTASFGFISNESNGRFRCSLDFSSYTDCASPKAYSNLALGAHNFRVLAIDSSGNVDYAAASYSWTIVTQVTALTDITIADLSLGALDPNAYLGSSPGAELILTPAAGIEFAGTAVPPGWVVTRFGTGPGVTVNNGLGTIDAGQLGTAATSTGNRSLEFQGMFTPALYESAGFGDDLNVTTVGAFFTTEGSAGHFAVKSNNGTTSTSTSLSNYWVGVPHRFRIDLNTSNVVYSIDGQIVATHAIAVSAVPLRPLMADPFEGDGGIIVDWMRMTPYAPAGSYLSRIFDGSTINTWASILWDATIPSGTSVVVSVRTGNTPIPDATWSSFTNVKKGAAIKKTSRYLQYRVQLKTTNVAQTPSVSNIIVTYISKP
jgi:hypothetical protein